MNERQASPAEPAALLAELHLVRVLSRSPGSEARVTNGALWAHARRRPGEPVALLVERAVRTDPGVRARYRAMLGALAIGASPVALAAADGGAVVRRLGEATLRLLPAEGEHSEPLLTLEGLGQAASALEVIGEAGSVRLSLTEPVDGTVVLAVTQELADAALLLALLDDAKSAVFLLP